MEETRYHTATITIYNRDTSHQKVQNLLHQHSDNITMRVGYPLESEKMAIIFLILNMSNDKLGALSGQLGQLDDVDIQTTSLNLSE